MTINLLDAILWELTEHVATFYHSRKNHIHYLLGSGIRYDISKHTSIKLVHHPKMN